MSHGSEHSDPPPPAPLGFGVQLSPSPVYFGRGAIASLPEVVARFGRTALVIADPFLVSMRGFESTLSAVRARGVEVRIVSDFEPELPAPLVERVAEDARPHDIDVVVGFGGGSALDLAKAVAVLLSYPAPISDYYGENAVPGEVLPIIAVPTTAGTGSEVTPVAVIADPDRMLKVGISDRRIVPRAAIVDPALTDSVPRDVTAASGADALVHALEAATARVRHHVWGEPVPVFVGRNSFSSDVALDAIGCLAASLPTAVADGRDHEARDRMARGSLLAGIAFGSAGTHLSHALQYPIGALTKTPHGRGTGILIPFVLQACVRAAEQPLAAIAARLGHTGTDAAIAAQFTVDRVARIMHESGLPRSLRELGVEQGDLGRIVEASLTVTRLVQNSPIRATASALRTILDAAYSGEIALLADAPFESWEDTR